MQEGHAFHSLHLIKFSSSSTVSVISAITSASFFKASLFIHLPLSSIIMNWMLNFWGQSFWKCPGFPHQWQVGGTILWGFVALMSIGTGVEIRAGRDCTVTEVLGFGKNRIVVVLLKRAELWSLPWKVALASQFSAQYNTALYQTSELESDGHPVGIWAIIFWIFL